LKGNRTTRSKAGGETTTYSYDNENRLKSVGGQYQGQPINLSYLYDYRNRRILRDESVDSASVVFSGGTSVQEWTASTSNCTSCHSPILQTEYIRGSDMGGGVGGLLYSLRPSQPIGFTHYNHRGDVVAKTDGAGTLTWQAAYEAFGTRRSEFGTTPDRQKANTKEEDPSGLINEGHRYRDLETGVFLTKDPASFVDGPNLYAYVRQNPWSKFDPEGLETSTLLQSAQAAATAAARGIALLGAAGGGAIGFAVAGAAPPLAKIHLNRATTSSNTEIRMAQKLRKSVGSPAPAIQATATMNKVLRSQSRHRKTPMPQAVSTFSARKIRVGPAMS
jgi:RHS repeat-associated protein